MGYPILMRNASVIADLVQTDTIYKTLKALQIVTLLDFTLRVGVHVVFSYRLSRVADLICDPSRRPTRLYPKRHFLSAAPLIVFAVILAYLCRKVCGHPLWHANTILSALSTLTAG
ncbi:hypothetical protein JG687_00017869 [Phytophthora cactorum]|uniref:Uncharacterized protein n=1 Tax=Phytophthora cactorum TaxID=29920 RepID=A0A8T1TN67_9STRA|nr:hypothetical protein JG687_00017869 [Phytophthora cactorum]